MVIGSESLGSIQDSAAYIPPNSSNIVLSGITKGGGIGHYWSTSHAGDVTDTTTYYFISTTTNSYINDDGRKYNPYNIIISGGSMTIPVSLTSSATETRPKNRAVRYLIRSLK